MQNNNQKCVFSSEIDKFCQEVYEDNFGEIPFGDITKIPSKEISQFDILAAGFPCQPFSYAGRLEGFNDKTRGTLFFEVARILNDKKPAMFILENVKGLKSHDKGKTLKTILETLHDIGYHTYWTVLNSHGFWGPSKKRKMVLCRL